MPGFDQRFPALASALEKGPSGLEPIFSSVAIEHMLDGHFLYRGPTREAALTRLNADPEDRQARWTLALLAVLANRPLEASRQFAGLEQRLPNNPAQRFSSRGAAGWVGPGQGRRCRRPLVNAWQPARSEDWMLQLRCCQAQSGGFGGC